MTSVMSTQQCLRKMKIQFIFRSKHYYYYFYIIKDVMNSYEEAFWLIGDNIPVTFCYSRAKSLFIRVIIKSGITSHHNLLL